jgi:predicted glycoside hydrolase/deacetylase ChbG (UPF0249 family)
MTKRLIVNADDFGMTAGVCNGIRMAAERGKVTSTTSMMCFPGSLDQVRQHYKALKIPSGVHLQLIGGKPLTPQIAELCDDRHNGAFPRRASEVAFPPHLVFVEWCAQVDCFIENFGTPSHLDSHHHLHRAPALVDVVLAVAQRYRLPVRGDGPEFAEKARLAGVTTADVVDERWTETGAPAETLIETIEAAFALAPDGVVEIVVHPGISDDELRRVSSLSDIRTHELHVLCSAVLDDYLERAEISLVDYQTLARKERRL